MKINEYVDQRRKVLSVVEVAEAEKTKKELFKKFEEGLSMIKDYHLSINIGKFGDLIPYGYGKYNQQPKFKYVGKFKN